MIRYLLLYSSLLATGERRWWPVSTWRIWGVCDVVWNTRPLPDGYDCRALMSWEPFEGFKPIRWHGPAFDDRPGPGEVRRIDLSDPILAESLAAMLPDQWRKEWLLPSDPKNPQP